jgi:hypothetical protein
VEPIGCVPRRARPRRRPRRKVRTLLRVYPSSPDCPPFRRRPLGTHPTD